MEKSLGQRHTVQRQAIIETIRHADGPLSVAEINERAQDRVTKLGIATVYRTLKLLLEAGEISQVLLPDGQTRYEASDLGHHHHFRCLDCERVYVLRGCVLPSGGGVSLPNGFRVQEHELILYGTCPKCNRRSR